MYYQFCLCLPMTTIGDVATCSVCIPYVSKRLLGTYIGFSKFSIHVLLSGFRTNNRKVHLLPTESIPLRLNTNL